ncbi:hypothetical protein AB0O68_15520 [Streptomyces sp. NPDC087512]|uniref:hypothetical protein n=1 Tax=Streptomyces sp. NPDC087512 TaxID=3155059 RepID=UPI003412FA41
MTDRPYTDDDLRAEAARQHAGLTEDPDFMGVGEAMEDAWVPSVETTEDGSARTWKQLFVVEDETGDDEDDTAYAEAQEKIHALIRSAANVSTWAVSLGADNLQPSTGHTITLNAGRPIARIHFAFEPGMPEEMRTLLVEGIGDAINEAGVEREQTDGEAQPTTA